MQHGLDARARQDNLANAFRCTVPVDDLRIMLVDDIVTTASTVRAASACLVDAGAFSVEVMVLARTLVE